MTATERWFHPNLSGQGAETLLSKKGVKGSFLFRPSQSSPKDCTLSIKQEVGVTHVRVRKTDDGYFLFPDEQFTTLTDLVQYYIESPVKEKDGPLVELMVPVYREDAIANLWYHGAIVDRDAEILLISKGREGSFLVKDSSDNTDGGYVLLVKTRDKVVNISILYKKSKLTVNEVTSFHSLSGLVEYYKEFPLTHKGQVLHLSHPFRSTSFSVLHIAARIQELEKHSDNMFGKTGFWDEFEQLQNQEVASLYSRKEGAKLENAHKNRYKNMMPFDHTLVSLKEPDVYGSTYINASFISGELPDSEQYYIAAQGCLETTADNFWTMVWYERCSVIVMLTNLIERGHPKCWQYWPEAIQPESYGKVFVTSLEETMMDQYTLRHFLISHDDYEAEERHVFHFHFREWPDHGVPQDCGVILEFLEQVNLKMEELKHTVCTSPLVVQCSEGIGRTGTLIAIDILIKLVEHQGWDVLVDVQRAVQLLRGQRSGMVQTDQQYKFIYQTLLYYIDASQKRTSACKGSPLAQKREESVYGNIKQGVSPLLKTLYRKRSKTMSPKLPPKPRN